MERVRASTAPLDAEYDARSGTPISAIEDDILMIEPDRRSIMWGKADRLARYTPRTLTAITLSQSSTGVRCSLPTPAMPALLTRTSMAPYAPTTCSVAASHDSRLLTSISH